MKILIAHNFYRAAATSGEDAVFRNECALLEQRGVEIVRFERHNDDIDESTLAKRIALALDGAWSRQSYDDLSRLIRQTTPDIVHFHNTFPLISPSAYAACQDHGVPVVQTMHNYRLSCTNGMLLRDEKPCELCIGRWPWPALQHRCYRSSLLATGAQVWRMMSNHVRGTYHRLVDCYIALTHFAANKLIQGGLPAERIVVKPNALAEIPAEGEGRGHYAIFVGRLGPEKGVKTLLDAWRNDSTYPLKIIGDGPLRFDLEREARAANLNVEFLGIQTKQEVLQALRGAEFIVVPSVCYEGLPTVVLEAFACSTPVVASRIGSLDEMVQDGETGVKFQAGDSEDLGRTIAELRRDPRALAQMRRKARAAFLENYTPNSNFKRLMSIYESVLEERKGTMR